MTPVSGKTASRREFLRRIGLSAVAVSALSLLPEGAQADVPDVLQIENISQASTGKVRLQIRHANPSSNHYVDTVEIDLNGQATTPALQPQTTNPFTAEFELGDIQGNPNVKARARCNLHGWSGWSTQIQIPEFPTPAIAAVAALATSLFLVKNVRK